MKKNIIGWKEECSLPELNIPLIAFKTDTGATLSALHTTDQKTFFKDGQEYVTFTTQPLKEKDSPTITCTAPVVRRKVVTSSNGMKQKRIVIKTIIDLVNRKWEIEITLTNREKMTYRMLLGREAMKGILVDPKKTYCLGHRSK